MSKPERSEGASNLCPAWTPAFGLEPVGRANARPPHGGTQWFPLWRSAGNLGGGRHCHPFLSNQSVSLRGKLSFPLKIPFLGFESVLFKKNKGDRSKGSKGLVYEWLKKKRDRSRNIGDQSLFFFTNGPVLCDLPLDLSPLFWLPRMDSNHDIQIQNLKSYH